MIFILSIISYWQANVLMVRPCFCKKQGRTIICFSPNIILRQIRLGTADSYSR